jgi:Restriction endonuclease
MATVNESGYQARIQAMDREALLRLWKGIRDGDTPGWPPGKAFEYLIIRAFELERADVRYPYTVAFRNSGSTLEQIDGAVHHAGLSALIEAKDQTRTLGVEPIAKMRNQLLRRPAAAIGAIFSRSGFSEAARILATFTAPQTILLWEEEELDLMPTRPGMCEALATKYRFAVEEGIPDYNLFEARVQS